LRERHVKNAELLVHLLEDAGVRWVFGIPSGPVLPFIEALRKSPVDFVLTASETSAGFMAATVGQLTGVPGVCVATLGPGATNMTTGVGAAWLDRAPTLAITCNVATPWLDRRIQMRIDHHALFAPITKASLPLRNEGFAETVAEALGIAVAEPPGPVHVDLPEDVAEAMSSRGSERVGARGRAPSQTNGGDEKGSQWIERTTAAIADALKQSRRPLVITGLSITRSAAAEPLRQFVERNGIPFISTLHGKGVLPENHPYWCGVLGRARRTDVQRFVEHADLIIAVGYDPIEINYEEWTRAIPVIHLDTEPADLGPSVNVKLNVGGDRDGVIARLAELSPQGNDWLPTELAAHRSVLEEELRPEGDALALHQTLDVLRAALPADGILAYDVGAHTHQIATQWRTDEAGVCLATNGWSSMGYGMPTAYAAKLVHPDRSVVAVVGDGGFQMTAGELAMARRLNLAVPTIVLNDGWLGLMKVKQERKAYPLSGVYLGDPPPSPAHYFGVPCRPAHTIAELQAALDWAFALDGPSVVEAFIDAAPYSRTVFD
jgi:acetolactate synthase-1/2/3 large subunit